MTPSEKLQQTSREKHFAEEKADQVAALAWLEAFRAQIGLTGEEYSKCPAVPREFASLVKFLSRMEGEDRTRFEWLMRQRALIDLELGVRYWDVGKRLRAKVLAAVESARETCPEPHLSV